MRRVYNEIVEYATTLQGRFELNKDKIKKVRRILRADRQMIEIIEDTKRLQSNISHYIQSDNQYVRDEYKNLRKLILEIPFTYPLGGKPQDKL